MSDTLSPETIIKNPNPPYFTKEEMLILIQNQDELRQSLREDLVDYTHERASRLETEFDEKLKYQYWALLIATAVGFLLMGLLFWGAK